MSQRAAEVSGHVWSGGSMGLVDYRVQVWMLEQTTYRRLAHFLNTAAEMCRGETWSFELEPRASRLVCTAEGLVTHLLVHSVKSTKNIIFKEEKQNIVSYTMENFQNRKHACNLSKEKKGKKGITK